MSAPTQSIQSSLTPAQTRRGMLISVYEGSFATIHATLIGGVFLTGLALRWGANTFQFGLLAAIPALFTASGIVGALLVSRLGERKPLTALTSVIGRSAFIAYLPFLLLHQRMPIWGFLVTVAAFNLLLVIGGNAWTSWMGDLVPKEGRGRYFGIRNTVMSLITMVITYAVGRYLDSHKTDHGFAYVCALGVLAGILAMVLLLRQPEPKTVQAAPPEPFLAALRRVVVAPMQDSGYRKYLRFAAVWALLAPLAGPFYGVHLLKNLSNNTYSILAIYLTISAASGITFQWIWGQLIDRFGAKPVMLINLFGTGFLPLLWVFATPRFLLPVWLDGVGNGLFWSGAGLASFSLVIGFAQGKPNQDAYFAMNTAAAGLGGFLSGVIGGGIAQALNSFHWNVGPFQFLNFHIMFLLAGIARFSSLPLFRAVPEEQARPVREVLLGLGSYAQRRWDEGRALLLDGVSTLSRRILPIVGRDEPKDHK